LTHFTLHRLGNSMSKVTSEFVEGELVITILPIPTISQTADQDAVYHLRQLLDGETCKVHLKCDDALVINDQVFSEYMGSKVTLTNILLTKHVTMRMSDKIAIDHKYAEC